MQEGTPPATGKWMEIVNNIFEDYKDLILLIHDNMLILAHTNEELIERIKLLVRRCFKHNMFLKPQKSVLGIHKVKFFRYEWEKNKFRIDERRRTDIQAVWFHSRLLSQSNSVVEHDHGELWSTAWSDKELLALEDIKQAVIQSCALHYPDDSKVLVIETDASDYGWGSVIYQVGADKVIEPIAFMGSGTPTKRSATLSMQA
jgi:hypothetical protein